MNTIIVLCCTRSNHFACTHAPCSLGGVVALEPPIIFQIQGVDPGCALVMATGLLHVLYARPVLSYELQDAAETLHKIVGHASRAQRERWSTYSHARDPICRRDAGGSRRPGHRVNGRENCVNGELRHHEVLSRVRTHCEHYHCTLLHTKQPFRMHTCTMQSWWRCRT